MGDVVHDAVVVTYDDYIEGTEKDPKVAEWRSTLPAEWQQLVVGPAAAVVNGYVTWAFLPDGSKSNWTADRDGAFYRQRFLELFAYRYEDGSTPFSVGTVAYGPDFEWLWLEQGVKRGDYVVYARAHDPDSDPPSTPAWERRREVPSMVIAVRDGDVFALEPDSLPHDLPWSAKIENVQVTHVASLTDLRTGEGRDA